MNGTPVGQPSSADWLQVLGVLLNPAGWFANAYDQSHGTLATIFRGLLLGTTDLADPARPFVANPTVSSFEPYVQALADAVLVVAVAYSFFRLMWSQSEWELFSVRRLLSRLLLGVILINFTLPFMQAPIDFEDALCQVVLGSSAALAPAHLLGQVDFGTSGLALLVVASLFVGYVVLALMYVLRYALLIVLAVTGPAAALALVVPGSQGYAQAWLRLFLAALFMQPLQLLVLTLGLALDGTTALPVPHAFSVAALMLAFKVPSALQWAAGMARSGGGMLSSRGRLMASAMG